jgi:hypothetical protein
MSNLLPLPQEILSLSDQETACTFCGISYLLLHKYESLTSTCQDLTQQLSLLQSFKDERPGLLSRVEILSKQAKDSQGLYVELEELKKGARIERDERRRREEECFALRDKVKGLEEERLREYKEDEVKMKGVSDTMRELKSEAMRMKKEILDVKSVYAEE